MIYPRSTIGTPTPPSSRTRLRNLKVLLAHEVGVNTPATGRYRSSDPVRVLSDARAAALYGASVGKTWEYSYMIGLDGSIFTQAGEVIAAHCLNFNDKSAAVIFLNATDVPLTPKQIASWYEVRRHMVNIEVLLPNHEVAPHYRYRQTSCCGIHAEPQGALWPSPTKQGRLGDLIPALRQPLYSNPTPPVEIPKYQGANDMMIPIYPKRNSDTRVWPGPIPAGQIVEFGLDPAIFPANTVAIAMNVTGVAWPNGAYLTIWGSGPVPPTSVLNFTGGTTANGFYLGAVSNLKFKLQASHKMNVICDVTAYWVP